MDLTVKSQKYSFFLFKILFFLIFLALNNAKALVIEDLKDGLLYQRFNDEFHFKTNIKVSTNKNFIKQLRDKYGKENIRVE